MEFQTFLIITKIVYQSGGHYVKTYSYTLALNRADL